MSSWQTLPVTLEPNSFIDLDIQFSPVIEGVDTAVLTIVSNDPNDPIVDVVLKGEGVTGVLTVEEQLTQILDVYNEAAEDGSIQGIGNEPSAKYKVKVFGDMLTFAGDLLASGDDDYALEALAMIEAKCDGQKSPKDFIKGSVAEELNTLINELINTLFSDSLLQSSPELTSEANDMIPDQDVIAVAKVHNPYGAGVLALGECDCPGIIFGGGGSVDDLTILGGGSLYVNASYNPGGSDGAIDQSGNAPSVVNVDRICVVGGIDDNFDYPEDAEINVGVEPEPDPYADLPDHDLPAIRAMPDQGTIADSNEPQTYSPGYYSGGIQITDSQVILMPGDYYLDSFGQKASMSVKGGLVTGEGVTLHIIGDASIGVDIRGNSNIDISAPEDNSTYAGVGIYQKRDPNYDCAKSCEDYRLSEFSGNAVIVIDGAVYMPHNKLELGGNGDIIVTGAVADRFYIYGNGQKVVNYKGERGIANGSYLIK
jgi:hypothetical protein